MTQADQGPYHAGARALQDRFDSRRIADRLAEYTLHERFSESDRLFIAHCPMFFLATAAADGQPDCSYKGGMPGFVRVVDEQTLVFPDYDGNGMFRSLGNIVVNPQVGLLFIDFEQGNRMRVNGRAALSFDDPLLAEYPGAQLIVRVTPQGIFPNCPRYIHKMKLIEYSEYVPRASHEPPVPGWKSMDEFKDALPKKV
jgi:predicted pyridoxine 5'-phosphate oxidase superfamily flavin-nucleotide-binding protein